MQLNLDKITKSLLIISVIWIVIDGVFRKWVFPELSTPLFAVKYVLFSLTYLLFLLKTNFSIPPIKKFYQFLIVLLAIWCLLNFLNPTYKTSWLVKIFGLINYLFFIPLTIIIPHYFNSFTFFEKTIRFIAYISIPIYIIGILQYFLPEDHILNYLPNEDQKFNKVAEFIRSNSIFSFVKIYNVYLLFTTTLFFGYIFYLYRKNKSAFLYIILLLFGILNQFMTGSRLPLGLMVASFIIISIYIFLNMLTLRKTITVSLVFGVITMLLAYNLSSTFNTAIDAFFKRSEFVEQVAEKGEVGYSAKSRLIDKLTPFKFAEQAGWLGFGIGTTYQGTGMVLADWRNDLPFEEEGERVVLELGIIGGFLIFLSRLSILLYCYNMLFRIKSIETNLLIIPLILIITPPLFFLNETTFNYLDNFIYWFAFSLVMALSKFITCEVARTPQTIKMK